MAISSPKSENCNELRGVGIRGSACIKLLIRTEAIVFRCVAQSVADLPWVG